MTDGAKVGRLVPRIDSAKSSFDAPAAAGEPRALRVSVWFGFAPVIADVVVADDETGAVTIKYASLEPKSFPGRIELSDRELDKLAIIRATGTGISLREAITARAREEAFA